MELSAVDILSLPVVPTIPLVNRENRRRFFFEFSRVIPTLENLNLEFYQRLFDETNQLSYAQLLSILDNHYRELRKQLIETYKPKTFVFKGDYFLDMYKPE